MTVCHRIRILVAGRCFANACVVLEFRETVLLRAVVSAPRNPPQAAALLHQMATLLQQLAQHPVVRSFLMTNVLHTVLVLIPGVYFLWDIFQLIIVLPLSFVTDQFLYT